jgi:hypothetical protein
MSDADDPDIDAFAEALRSKTDATPEFKAFAEGLIARMKHGPAYYDALGHFVSDFSRIETTLQQALWMAAGVEPTVARAIFSGLKVEGCLQFMKRIADAKKWKPDQKRRLEEITQRLGPLNKLRNDILHYGVTLDVGTPDSWLFSNRNFAHIPEKIREFSITPRLLTDASADLSKLFYLTVLLSLYDRPSPKFGRSIEKKLAEHLDRAWRYKPPQPTARAGTNRRVRQKGPRQRPASLGKQ